MTGHKISLQELLSKFHLSQDLPDKGVNEEHLRAVSVIIDDHEVMGPELGLTAQEMIAIDRDARTHELKKQMMLSKWKQKFSMNATYRILIEALLQRNRADYAGQVCELLAQSKCSWSCGYVHVYKVSAILLLLLQVCLLNGLVLTLHTLQALPPHMLM